ncbi:N-acetylmuramoyl-L-alanine amidase [Bacillus sp. FSL K6-1109]|jgi:N-acetylmuramoyl-L-alanine amidase|uniref:N-acetylmuramoyl-L-alanine amidase n=1 Tax=Bacillus licheniformis TaxID=1402 RepID=A0AB37GQ42_BACLI|nr:MULTISPECIES: N-acetylmuramoyl-L-alanine amidase [Bacillus]MBW4887038.1 N-acetylmuramoyl-L-alanine amidase [Bacillus sp. (in: firmicutes)]MDE1398455.1 N-acetylmuramoyl-L-alanine amidase [Bacillus licheniformis]MED1024970.1 N-acetylmuramoyl-L-alanine amidase [Bacillus licheniformis]MED1036107.1 N-acetylmuramoyl-L-alanine amidase [Bacillus licheniformis]MED1102022.1 N-acetylmuramoyl-L-alanine amidase [Bacillus licheniformis]
MVKVVKNYVKVNQYTRPGLKLAGVKGIVMHWTATPGASALNERNYFNGTCIADKRYASAHYFVDRKEAQHIIPENEVAYHAHDQNRCYVSFLKPNANTKSISVEMCVEKDGKIHSQTIQNAAELVADLCKRYGLSTNKIVRHYDVTNKNCPAPWVSDSSQLTAFRKKVDSLLGKKTVSKTTPDKKSSSSSKKQTSKKYTLPSGIYKVKSPLMKGTAVRQIQEALAAVYYYPDKGAKNNGIDGYYGPKTANAVKRFQLMHGLSADGIYGPKTKAKLEALLK